MTKNKKPTMNEVKSVISNILMDMSKISKAIYMFDKMLSEYIDFKGDKESFIKHIQDEQKNEEKINDTKSEESGDSSRGTGTNKAD